LRQRGRDPLHSTLVVWLVPSGRLERPHTPPEAV